MAEPYLKKDAGDIIRAQDWNEMQSKARDHVAGHTHTGGEQGPPLSGAAIARDAELKVKSLAVDALSVDKDLAVSNKIQAEGSAIYFTGTHHAHSGEGNKKGHAAIENDAESQTLMILGHTREVDENNRTNERYVQILDHLEVTRDLEVKGDLSVSGKISANGKNISEELSSRLPLAGGTLTGELTPGGGLRMADRHIWLRNDTDKHHGLVYGGSRDFGGEKPDGPLLFGFAGGGLGTTEDGDKIALAWDAKQNVKIKNSLNIARDLFVGGGLEVTSYIRARRWQIRQLNWFPVTNSTSPTNLDIFGKIHSNGGVFFLIMTGTVWTTMKDISIGARLTVFSSNDIDKYQIHDQVELKYDSITQIYANSDQFHYNLPTLMSGPIKLEYGDWTFNITGVDRDYRINDQVRVDFNDRFSLAVFEFPFE